MAGCAQPAITKKIRIDSQAHSSGVYSRPLHQPILLSKFGPRNKWFHTGIDLKGRGKNALHVLAARDGRVVKTGWIRGYGNIIELKHADGYKSRYAHLKRFKTSLGKRVATGEVIGIVGATGRASAPHLHFEIMTPDNRYADPCRFIRCP